MRGRVVFAGLLALVIGFALFFYVRFNLVTVAYWLFLVFVGLVAIDATGRARSILFIRYTIAAVIIYILPALVLVIGLALMHPFPLLEVFIPDLVFGPAFLLVTFWSVMVPYFAIAYGLLYWFYHARTN